jgi:hypothetical protein
MNTNEQPPSDAPTEGSAVEWVEKNISYSMGDAFGVLYEDKALELAHRADDAERLASLRYDQKQDALAAQDTRRAERDALAAEVERLREQADAVCEWFICPTTDRYKTEECAEGPMSLNWQPNYCPGCGRKVKIQPQTNDQR